MSVCAIRRCLTPQSSTSVARFVRSLTPLTGIKLERDTTTEAFHEPCGLPLITVLFHHPKCNFSMCVSSVNSTSNPNGLSTLLLFFLFLWSKLLCPI